MTKLNISEIDPNFKTAGLDDSPVNFFDVRQKPFELTGVFWDEPRNGFARLPQSVIDSIGNVNLQGLGMCTSGGQVRFRTDSTIIAIRYELCSEVNMLHMPLSGSSGFDLFNESEEFIGKAWSANFKQLENCAMMVKNLPGQMSQYSINLPLYNGVRKLEIGVLAGSRVEAPAGSKRLRVCFYGSSITQGGCASKPGNAYTSMLCRWNHLEQINRGFSGNGRGEPQMAEYIASLKPDLFVLDYDHNAPTLEHLQKTHQPFFKTVRDALPDIPVIMISRPGFKCDNNKLRRDVIRATWQSARDSGDTKVLFVDGETMFAGVDPSACTMDGCHPNDLGFFRMAATADPVLKEALKLCPTMK